MKLISFEQPTIERVEVSLEVGRKISDNPLKRVLSMSDPVYDTIQVAGRLLHGKLFVHSDVSLPLDGIKFDVLLNEYLFYGAFPISRKGDVYELSYDWYKKQHYYGE